MAAHTESRPSSSPAKSRTSASSPPEESWNPYLSSPDLSADDSEDTQDTHEREAIPPPPSEPRLAEVRVASAVHVESSMGSTDTNEILQSLTSLTDKVKDGVNKDAIVDTVKSFAKSLQQRVAKLGGVLVPEEVPNRPSDVATARFSWPARTSLSPSLDGYRPDRDVVAPISVRPNAMELLWVCGDCGQHYPRARECPDACSECGAPRQHFYAPIED